MSFLTASTARGTQWEVASGNYYQTISGLNSVRRKQINAILHLQIC